MEQCTHLGCNVSPSWLELKRLKPTPTLRWPAIFGVRNLCYLPVIGGRQTFGRRRELRPTGFQGTLYERLFRMPLRGASTSRWKIDQRKACAYGLRLALFTTNVVVFGLSKRRPALARGLPSVVRLFVGKRCQSHWIKKNNNTHKILW